MAEQGPNAPDTVTDDSAVGTITWSKPGNAAASDDLRATAVGGGQSHYLKAVDFGFTIPAGATVGGVVVTIERHTANIEGTADTVVSLVKGGSVVGDNKAEASWWPDGGDAPGMYGGADQLWGTTWTAAEINAADFGVVLSATNSGVTDVARVDAISITVTYSGGGLATRRALLGVGT